MEISVLMSVYKAENPTYLDRALKSVWSDQSLKPGEIILVEDGPLGESLYDIIRKWKKELGETLVIIKNEINLGLTKSLNKGIPIAKGKYIARMDSDDISLPERFELQYQFLEENRNISVVGGDLQEFDVSHESLGIRTYPRTMKDVRNYIYRASPLAHPAVMMRREIFDSGIKYDEKYRTSQDIALWFDVLGSGREIANVNKVLLKFRRGDDVYKRRSKEKAKNELRIYLSGIRRLFGTFNPYYIFPLSRYLFRLMPLPIIKAVYNSDVRSKFLRK